MYVPEGDVEAVLNDLVVALGHQVSQATRDMFLQLHAASRPQPQEETMRMPDIPEEPHPDQTDMLFAPPQTVRPAPEAMPCRGLIVRKVDTTGISGVGTIGEVCVFSDGAAVYRWLGGGPQDQPKFEFYDNPGLGPFLQISGHNGNTEVIMIDDLTPHQQ